MYTLNAFLVGHELRLYHAQTLAAGSVAFDKIHFDFDESWEGLSKVALFWDAEGDPPVGNMVDAEDNALIPWEALENKGRVRFGVYGVTGSGDSAVRATSTLINYRLPEGAWSIEGQQPTPAEQTIIEQAIAAIQSAVENLDREPIIRNGIWYTWDINVDDYVSTGVSATGPVGPQGPKGDPGDVTPEAQQALAAAQAAAQAAAGSAQSAESNAADAEAAAAEVDQKLDGVSAYGEVGPVAIASIQDALPLNAESLVVDIEPVQSGSGDPSPTNVRPMSGWTGAKVTRAGKNLIDLNRTQGTPSPSDYANTTKPRVMDTSHYYGGITRNNYYNPNSVSNININGSTIKITGSGAGYGVGWPVSVKPNTQYTISANIENIEVGYGYYDVNWNFLSNTNASSSATRTLTTPSNCEYCLIAMAPRIANVECTISDIQLELGSTATDYEPYQDDIYNITFPSAAGTVYDGRVDLVNGKLQVYPYFASYNGEALVGPWISSMDKYEKGATPTIGAQVVDMGGTPVTYDLTPQQIALLRGNNTIFADCGDTTVGFWRDDSLSINKAITERAYDRQQGEALADKLDATQSGLAIIVDGDTASMAVPVGDFAYIKNNTHGLSEGLYTNTSAAAFPASGGTADGTVFTAESGGGLNAVNSRIAHLIKTKIIMFSDLRNSDTSKYYIQLTSNAISTINDNATIVLGAYIVYWNAIGQNTLSLGGDNSVIGLNGPLLLLFPKGVTFTAGTVYIMFVYM